MILNYISDDKEQDKQKNQIIDLFQFFLSRLSEESQIQNGRQFRKVLCKIGTISYNVKQLISESQQMKFKFKVIDFCIKILEYRSGSYLSYFQQEIMRKENNRFSEAMDEIIKNNYSKIKKQVKIYYQNEQIELKYQKNCNRHIKVFKLLEMLCSNRDESTFKNRLSNINQDFQQIDFVQISCIQIHQLSYNYNVDSLEIINQILKFLN